jgi:sarcosine oxidase
MPVKHYNLGGVGWVTFPGRRPGQDGIVTARRVDADVAVIGLGAMGSHALWRLSRLGVRVVGIDQFAPGHDRGASHGESRIIRTAYAEGAGYVPVLREAWRLWAELEAVTGESLVQRIGGLMLGPAGSWVVAGAIRSAEEHRLEHEVLDAAAVRARFPQHRVDAGTVGCYERDAGAVFPERAVVAAVRAAEALGATVAVGDAVTHIVPDADSPRVRVGERTLTVGHVVVAAGGWTRRLVPALAGHLRVVRRVMGWFAPADPAGFAPDRFPVFIRAADQDAALRTWYGMPRFGAGTVKLGLHDWPGIDEPVDPVRGPRAPDDADARRLADLAAGTLAGLRPDPVLVKPCTYTLTPDRNFVVGQRRDLPGLTLLAGFSGHGFKFAPAIGEIAARLAVGAPSPLPVALFDPHRFDHSSPAG